MCVSSVLDLDKPIQQSHVYILGTSSPSGKRGDVTQSSRLILRIANEFQSNFIYFLSKGKTFILHFLCADCFWMKDVILSRVKLWKFSLCLKAITCEGFELAAVTIIASLGVLFCNSFQPEFNLYNGPVPVFRTLKTIPKKLKIPFKEKIHKISNRREMNLMGNGKKGLFFQESMGFPTIMKAIPPNLFYKYNQLSRNVNQYNSFLVQSQWVLKITETLESYGCWFGNELSGIALQRRKKARRK